jgi:hypothetical protein
MEPITSYVLDAAGLRAIHAGRPLPPLDPIMKREFVVGDTIVICGADGCKIPILLASWETAGNCGCVNLTPVTGRMLELDSPGARPPFLTRVWVGVRQTPPRRHSFQVRLLHAAVAEAILGVIAYIGWSIFQGFLDLPHTWHPEGIVWLLEPLIVLFILLPLFVIYIGVCLVGSVVLAGGAIAIIVNLFAAPASYVNPVERIWLNFVLFGQWVSSKF